MIPSEAVVAEVRRRTDTVLLSFSTGKDSIAAYLAIRDVFPHVVPYYLYLVPGLEFVEQSLEYYEGVFGRRIVRLPHPSLYRMLSGLVFQPPERCEIIEHAALGRFTYHDINTVLIEELGLPPATHIASGVRAVDSPIRWAHFQRRGAINENTRQFYPVYDWRKARLIDAIKCSGIKLPVDYKLFGRSFDGIDLRFLYPIRQHFPRDYQRILDWFPLADMELARYEFSHRPG